MLLKQHWIDRLDKHFVNRIHLQNNLYVDFIYGHKSLIKVTRHRFKPIFILHLHLKPVKTDKVNIQSLLDFASCPLNNFIPFVLIHTFNSYTTIINQIANYKWFLRMCTPKKIVWSEMQSPSHFTYAKRKHNKRRGNTSNSSQPNPKNGHHETALYRSFLINRWIANMLTEMLCISAQHNTYNQRWRTSKIKKKIPYTISTHLNGLSPKLDTFLSNHVKYQFNAIIESMAPLAHNRWNLSMFAHSTDSKWW